MAHKEYTPQMLTAGLVWSMEELEASPWNRTSEVSDDHLRRYQIEAMEWWWSKAR